MSETKAPYNVADMIEYIDPGPGLDEYRVELPRAYFDADDLDVYEFRLLAHYSQRGEGFGKQGTRAIAKACKMSKSEVSSTRASLAAKGYLIVSANENEYGTLNVTVVSKWGVRHKDMLLKDSINTCPPQGHPPPDHQYLSAWVSKFGKFKNEEQAFAVALIHDTYGADVYIQVIDWLTTNTYKSYEARIRAASTAAKNWNSEKRIANNELAATGKVI